MFVATDSSMSRLASVAWLHLVKRRFKLVSDAGLTAAHILLERVDQTVVQQHLCCSAQKMQCSLIVGSETGRNALQVPGKSRSDLKKHMKANLKHSIKSTMCAF